MESILRHLSSIPIVNILGVYVGMPFLSATTTSVVMWGIKNEKLSAKRIVYLAVFILGLRLLCDLLYVYAPELVGFAKFFLHTLTIWIIFGDRKRSDLRLFLEFFILHAILETLATLLAVKIIPLDLLTGMFDQNANVTVLIVSGSCVLSALLCSIVWRMILHRKWIGSPRSFYITSAFVALLAITIPFLPLSTAVYPDIPNDLSVPSQMIHFVALLFSVFLMLLLVNYIVMHANSVRQIRINDTLKRQQLLNNSLYLQQEDLQKELLKYLEGVESRLYSGDIHTVQTYQKEMKQEYRAFNQENLIAIQRIASPSVRGLLKAHVEKFQARNVPFYVFCSSLDRWCSMSDVECCAMLGALLDNAYEAAIQSKSPLVILHIGSRDQMVEIILRNTFETIPDVQQMKTEGYTTKKDSRGVGLKTVRTALEGRGSMLATIQGQYFIQHIALR